MSVRALVFAGILAGAIAIAGCGGSSSSSGAGSAAGAIPAFNSAEKVTVTYWVPFTGSELELVRKVVGGFERAHPNVKVNVVGNINDEKIIAAAHSGNVP